MSEKYYILESWNNNITEISLDKETEHFYFVNNRRISKQSKDQIIGKDKEKIKQKMIDYVNEEISDLERRINYHKSKIQKIQSL